jgi:hypothetical protein
MDQPPREKRLNRRVAMRKWGRLSSIALQSLDELANRYALSVLAGDLLYLNGKWYITHSGLVGVACRYRCAGIHVQVMRAFCDPANSRWAFKATVYKTLTCKGFVGFGDADPSNVSPLVRGAEMRIAETRAVNRALRKAYGIGVCSVEELGIASSLKLSSKLPEADEKLGGSNGHAHSLRDRLNLLIRQYQLDPLLVKRYAADFCGTQTLRNASRELVEDFIATIAKRASEDLAGLKCQLNSYQEPEVRS